MVDISEEDEVLSLYYQGYSRKEIHEKLPKHSTGKISKITLRERARLGSAAVDYIRRLGKVMHKEKITWADISESFVLIQTSRKYGLDFDDLKDNLPAVLQRLDTHHISLSDLPLDIDEKVDKGKEASKLIEKLQEEIKDLNEQKAKKIAEAGHTDDSIAKCRELTEFLEMMGLSRDAPLKLMNAIKAAESSDFDSKTISDKLAMNKTLEIQIENRKQEFEDIDTKYEKRRTEYWEDTEAIDDLKFLKGKNVKAADISAMKDLVEIEGSNLASIKEKAVLHGTLDKANAESEIYNQKLAAQKEELEPAVQTLNKTKQGLENLINENLESLTNSMQSIKAGADGIAANISKAEAEALSKIQAMGQKGEQVLREFAKTRGVLLFEPLVREGNGEHVDSKQLRDSALLAMTILQSRLGPRSSHKNLLDVLIKDLKDDATLGTFT